MSFWEFLSTQSGGVLIGGSFTVLGAALGVWIQGRKELKLQKAKIGQELALKEYEHNLAQYNELRDVLVDCCAAFNYNTVYELAQNGNTTIKTRELLAEAQKKFTMCSLLIFDKDLLLKLGNLSESFFELSEEGRTEEQADIFSADATAFMTAAREYIAQKRPTPPLAGKHL